MLITVMIRAVILFTVVVLSMRLMGKRQVGQLLPYELSISLMIADVASSPMENIGVPIMQGIVPALTLVVMHGILSMISLKNQKARGLISGRPSILVHQGIIQEGELRDLCFSLSDLLEEFRAVGYLNPAEVGTAILETSGKLSVFPCGEARPMKMSDMALEACYEGIPLPLVMDGLVQGENLALAGLDANWLDKQLKKLGFFGVGEIFLASLDTSGDLLVQGRGKNPKRYIYPVLDKEKVIW